MVEIFDSKFKMPLKLPAARYNCSTFQICCCLFQLASIHLDPLEEPIVDVTIGGYSLPNLEEGAASVWIVTIDGKVRNSVF